MPRRMKPVKMAGVAVKKLSTTRSRAEFQGYVDVRRSISRACVNDSRSADHTVTTAISTVIYLALTLAIFALLGLAQRLIERL